MLYCLVSDMHGMFYLLKYITILQIKEIVQEPQTILYNLELRKDFIFV